MRAALTLTRGCLASRTQTRVKWQRALKHPGWGAFESCGPQLLPIWQELPTLLPMARSRRTAVERKLLAQVVAQRHLQDQVSFTDLATELGISERGARQLYQIARTERLVRVTVMPMYSAPPVVDTELSMAITSRPSMLRRAIVVDVPAGQVAEEGDEFLHRQLANAAARHLLNELHDGDRLAVAGGRGPAYTADALTELIDPGKEFTQIHVVSLCGGSIRRLPRSVSASGALDADIVADSLTRSLGSNPSNTNLVLLPLALAERSELAQVVQTVAPHVMPAWWESTRVDICIVGAGVMTRDPEYFLHHHFRAHSEAIAELLLELEDQILSQEEPGVVADVAQRLWLTRDVVSVDPEYARDIIHRINSRLIGVDLKSLDRTREKILVAGGTAKYAALQAIVLGTRCDFRPSMLITDSATARRLRDELQAI